MSTVELTWIDKQRFLGVDSGQHSVVLSSADDVGLRPADALLLALAGCTAYDVVAIIRKQRHNLRGLHIVVSGEQAAAQPRPFRRIHLRVTADAAGLQPEQLARAVDLALNKYCTVRASLHPDIDVSFETAIRE